MASPEVSEDLQFFVVVFFLMYQPIKNADEQICWSRTMLAGGKLNRSIGDVA